MNDLFSQETTLMEKEEGVYTSQEIARQPKTWAKVWDKINNDSKEISSFIKRVLTETNDNLNVVLTGAGSSAYIGDVASYAWLKAFSKNTQAIPTTDLVTHFKKKIASDKPLLLISFGRSGNSPESKAAIEIAEKECQKIYHLIITCNSDGRLAKLGNKDNTYVFLLPPESEDKSLAMTNSFTSMALAAVLIAKLFQQKKNVINQNVENLINCGNLVLEEYNSLLYEVSEQSFNRIIFLGSGPLLGIAKESHLKVQELTNGEVVGKFDSFLGFRHGPKALINENTLLIYLISNQPEVLPYEMDLINQIKEHGINLKTLAIAEKEHTDIDMTTLCLNNKYKLEEDFWAILCTLPAQIIGFYKSLIFSLNPDNPSPERTISRVVEGVKIYDGAF